jgi:hypothetical protein
MQLNATRSTPQIRSLPTTPPAVRSTNAGPVDTFAPGTIANAGTSRIPEGGPYTPVAAPKGLRAEQWDSRRIGGAHVWGTAEEDGSLTLLGTTIDVYRGQTAEEIIAMLKLQKWADDEETKALPDSGHAYRYIIYE